MKIGKKAKTPRYFRITIRGKWFIFITIALGIAAVNTGNNLVYLCLAMNLSLMITSGILSDLVTRRVMLNVMPAMDIFARKPGKILVTVKNEKKFLPIFYLKIILNPENRPHETVISHVAPGKESSTIVEALISKRGLYRIDKISVMTRFPFGFFEKYYHLRCDIAIIVFPHPAPIPSIANHPMRTQNDAHSALGFARAGTGHSLRNIREFVPSDPVKKVLWKKFMHTKKLYVRELEDEIEGTLIIEVNPEEDQDAFEKQLELYSGILVELRRRELPFMMKINTLHISSAHYSAPYHLAQALLSVVERDGSVPVTIEKLNSILRK